MLNIFAIIISYNDKENLFNCLSGLKRIEHKDITLHTYVVDNASNLFDPDEILEQFPYVNLIKSKINLGFGTANNIVIKKAVEEKADYVLLLNQDTLPDKDPHFLAKLLGSMEENKTIGVSGPALEHYVNDKLFYDYGGVLNLNLARGRHINLTEAEYTKLVAKKTSIKTRDFVSAACMLIRVKNVLEAIRFDENYFLYLEDVDICIQIYKLGYKIVNIPESMVFHVGGTSGGDFNKLYHSFKSSLRFVYKWIALPWKPIGFFYNLIFYPYLGIIWSLKRVKRRLLKSR